MFAGVSDAQGKAGPGYPDFIEDGGDIMITETQKTTARCHVVAPALVTALLTQHERKTVATGASFTVRKGSGAPSPLPAGVLSQ